VNHGDGVGRCGENVSAFTLALLKKNLYVITLKSFNRIFDYSSLMLSLLGGYYPTGPSEIINA
jgi:hypothetical protein